jgi:hypothetical protein
VSVKEQIQRWKANDARRIDHDVDDVALVLHRDDKNDRWCLVAHANGPLGPIVRWHAVFYTFQAATACSCGLAISSGKRGLDSTALRSCQQDDGTILEVWA